MSINTTFPTPVKLIQEEIKTLKFLMNQTRISQFCGDAGRAYSVYNKYPQLIRKNQLKNFNFYFNTFFDVPCADIGLTLRIFVNADVKIQNNSYEKVCYHLIVTKKARRSQEELRYTLFRNFHFDYNPKANESGHPFFHLQYGGGTGRSFGAEYAINITFPSIDLPRISYKPMSLALLMQIVFMHFYDENVVKLREDNDWKSILWNNEQLCWKDYYAECSAYLNSEEKHILCNHFCGK
ncbi:MAG: hypothetical protein HY811_06850 [Planctomycetes bacterium]|nr:hypothetical protein [Planctomycetota bacterium]